MNTQLVELEEGWSKIQEGAIERCVQGAPRARCVCSGPHATHTANVCVRRLQGILEDDLTGHKFDNKEYMTYFTLVYNMCTQKPPHNYSEQLYQRYKKAISDYLNSAVLPAVREKTGQYMLKEVGKRWQHHKINVKWMKSFFSYLVRRLRCATLTQSLSASRRA